MATARESIYKDEFGGDIRYRLVIIITYHPHTHLCRIKVWNRRNLNIRPQVVILPYIGALVKLVHIIKKSCLACMLDTLRDEQICLSTPILSHQKHKQFAETTPFTHPSNPFLPDPLAPTQTVRVILTIQIASV